MADILTPAELDAIRGRCEAPVPQGLLGTLEYNAHARADIPALLAHVAALEAELARWLPVDRDTQTYSISTQEPQP